MNQFKKVAIATALTTAVAGAALAAPKQGGTVTVPVINQAGLVEVYNPFATGVNKDVITGVMFEPLWANNVMAGEINYRLAESFSYADDLMSMTIKLRDGLKWSDGNVLNADDVVFSLNAANEDIKFDFGGLWGNKTFGSVKAVDDRTVLISFQNPTATADWFIPEYYILPEHIWSGVADKVTFANNPPVGSGMFTEVNSANANQIELCRNPQYYLADKGIPYLDCFKARNYTDNSQIQPALMNDEIDWGSNFIADVEKTYVGGSKDHKFWYPANDLIHVYLNTKKAPFNDLNFRKAFSMALDRPTIVDLAAYGYPTPETNATGIGQYFQAFFNNKINKKYNNLTKYNPKGAAKLLANAGYKDVNGDGFLEAPDGSEINFDIHVVNGWTDWVQSVQMVSEYLAEVGIKANTKTVDWSVYDAALKEGTYEASINWSVVGANPISTYRDYFHTGRIGSTWHAGHGIHDDHIDGIIDEYFQINDEDRRKEILDELMVFTAENMAFVPLFSNPTWFQYNTSRVAGWPSEKDPYVQPVFYNQQNRLLILERLYMK